MNSADFAPDAHVAEQDRLPAGPAPRNRVTVLVPDARARCLSRDLSACGRYRVPAGAESHDTLPVRVAGVLITREEVERVAGVSDLWTTVGAHRACHQRGAAPPPTVGVPVAWSGGQELAQAPVHSLWVPVSFANRYGVRPCESTRI